MVVRYVREEEALSDVIRAGRRAQRNANRPTGTERARTMETAELAATGSEFAKELAEELGLRTDELTDDVAAVAAVAAVAQTTADAAQVEAETARSEATSKAAAAQAAAEEYAFAEAEAARLAAIAEASGDASDKAAAAEAAAVVAAAQDATAKADAAEAAAKADAAAAQSTANDAASAAAAAQSAAGNAADLAQQAQDSASGKNTIHRDTTAPSGVGKVDGDKWERFDTLEAGGKLVGTWSWYAGQWRSTTIAEAYLPLVDIGSGTYGTLAGGRLAATAIDGMTITGALLRTAPSGQRMQFDVNGLRAFNATNHVVATINAEAGGMRIGLLSDGRFEAVIDTGNATARVVDYLGASSENFAGAGVFGTQGRSGDRFHVLRTLGSNTLLNTSQELLLRSPSSITLDAPVVTFQGDTRSDSYLNKSGGTSAPYAMAAGKTPTLAAAGTTITLPVGRFTQVPALVAGQTSGSAVCVPYITSRTVSSFKLQLWTIGTAQTAALPAEWIATQMTATNTTG